ncbi:MAG: class I SAM-dependent rRNA methyltransferase [Anaerolineales bacterium]
MDPNRNPRLLLKPGREKSILRRHPWIFSGAVERVDRDLEGGEIVDVFSSTGDFLAVGAYSPNSQIRCRVWAFSNDLKRDSVTESDLVEIIKSRMDKAIGNRLKDKNLKNSNAYRLVHGESDLLPGLIVDVYGDVAVVQFLSSGIEKLKEKLLELLLQTIEINLVYERSDAEVRALEGLPERSGILYGESSESQLTISENDLKFVVNYSGGHKTGFYLDQRDNRYKIRQYSENKEVLDCFCYSGGFSLNAMAGGASKVTSVDTSEEALATLKENIGLNNFSASNYELIQMDVFKQLRLFRDQGKEFDLIVLDPPKFAPTRKQVERAARGYKDINLMAMKLLRSGGILFTFSCSGGVDQDLFQKIIAGAALDAGGNLQIIERMSQASDHPVLSSFPEGEYLKGLICRKL